MIRSFACKETEKIYMQSWSKKFPAQIQKRALIKLMSIHNANELQDLRIPPSNNLEALQGNREGQFSIRINNQWRICFVWNEDGTKSNVEIVDYH